MFCNDNHGYIITVDLDKKELIRKTRNLSDGTTVEESTHGLSSYDQTSEDEYQELGDLPHDIESAVTLSYRTPFKQKLIITSSKTFGQTLYSLDKKKNSYVKMGSSDACIKKVECSSYSHDAIIMEALRYVGMIYPSEKEFCQSEKYLSLAGAGYEDILMTATNTSLTHVRVIVNEVLGGCSRRAFYIKPARFPGDNINRVTGHQCLKDY
jgi:hypothetical protein